jgi:hypothetical protein
LRASEIYPIVVTDDSPGKADFEAKLTAMWSRLARGLATAAAYERRVERDPKLAALLRSAPVSLVWENGRVRPELEPPDVDSARADSVVTLLRQAVADTAADLYTVRLLSYVKGSHAESLVASVSIPEPDEDVEAGWDSTVVLDIRYVDCFASQHQTAFVLPPEVTPDRKFWWARGLYYSADDAKKAAARGGHEWGVEGKVVKLRATGSLLRLAFARRE